VRIIEVEYLGPPALGGVEAVVETLSRRFAAAGHETEIWCTDLLSFAGPRHEEKASTFNGVNIRRFSSSRSRFFLLDPYHLRWRGLKRALLQAAHEGAVFHLHPFPSSHAMTALAALAAGAVVVITPHHEVESLRRYRHLWRGGRTLSILLAAARKCARLCLGVHTWLEAKFWQEEVGWPEEQLRVIPNGVDLAEFDELSKAQVQAAAGRWPPGDVRLLFVGRLAPAKGIDLLLRALAQTSEASLLAVGPDAGALTYLRKLAWELALEKRVCFTGPLPRREVCAAFRACHIFILPSRFGENFGIVAIEAMAAGKPVVASDCGGLPTIVRQGENGLIFPAQSVAGLKDALSRLMASEKLRQTYGEAGRKMVQAAYTWESVAQAYLALFTTASERKPPADS